jgi:hypothetical protein
MRTTATPCGSEMTIEEAFLHDAFAQAAQHVSTRTSAPAQYQASGAVRTRVPQVELRFKGYLIRETAGTALGTPPLIS